MQEPILIGNGQGFWGDSIDAPKKLIEDGPIHYVTLDYLAEVTMSIMQRQKLRDPQRGYATDFVQLMKDTLPTILDKNIKVIANAGGVNPTACREAIFIVARELGLTGLKIGIVEGDDIVTQLPKMMTAGVELNHMETGEPLTSLKDNVLSANVYISSLPIA